MDEILFRTDLKRSHLRVVLLYFDEYVGSFLLNKRRLLNEFPQLHTLLHP